MMTPYHSNSGKISGVISYQTGNDFIIVRFKDADYKYSYESCGINAIERMKNYAEENKGLSTFIAREQPRYEWKR